MAGTLYEKGRAREYTVMKMLKEEGWMVSRSAASHGAVDVFAAKGGRLLLVQVKSGKARVKKEEMEELVRWGRESNGDAEVWHFKGRGHLEKRRVHASKERSA
jgi:Holliday junction resolvase